jgi:hypothetical protein
VPFALDGETIQAAANAGGLRILNGQGALISIGAPGANLHQYAGVAAITFYTERGQGSRPARILADRILAAFTGLKLDETGEAVAPGAAVVLDFTRAGIPYLAASVPEPPLHRSVVNLPFTRTERK